MILSRTQKLPAELAALQALLRPPMHSRTTQPPRASSPRSTSGSRTLSRALRCSANSPTPTPPTRPSVTKPPASSARSPTSTRQTTAPSATIEEHLSAADPTNLDRLAAIGDIYADSAATSLNLDAAQQLAQAAPFWRRMSAVHPGTPDGYLQSATVFWDYFQFDDALTQIVTARRQFKNPALYGYEAGAIEEAKRDDAHAVAEYVAAAIAGDSESSARLLTLAARPQFATLVDQATSAAVSATPSVAALDLRAQVLTAQHHSNDLAPLLDAAISHTTTASDLEAYAAFAQQHQLTHAYQTALQRETSLSNDPVQQIQLQYQLAQSYEDQNDIAAAQRVIESVYANNPKLVGVIRSTVDFYWNHKQPQRAVATLSAAAHAANASLAHDYTLEAVDKSNHSGDFTGARALLQPLLAADPFNARYLDLEGQSFSLAHDDAGLRDLYTNTLIALQKAPLSTQDRRDKIALARQGLIPALTDLKDYPGAMDQHIALISAFPEDDSILQAAVSYARLHQREPQLVAFLNKAVADSPRDSRFAIDLARVDVQLEDATGALAAYSKAIAIRGDRADLFIARADLEEHQQAFDAACADYERLYHLTYNDPQWMEKAALARARQGKPELAVKALQAAWIDGRPDSAANEFRVAQQLEQWNLLPQAETFATQGIQLAGDDLLANPDDNAGALAYARLLARERKAPEALVLLTRILQASSTSPSAPSVIVQQIEKKGVADVTDSQWRAQLVLQRQQRAQATFRSAVLQIASVAAEFYTPEEKSAFATLLDTQHSRKPPAGHR
jgi:predicted Zn-dependent protease